MLKVSKTLMPVATITRYSSMLMPCLVRVVLLSWCVILAPVSYAADTGHGSTPGTLYGYGGEVVEVNGRDMYIRCVGSAPGPLVVMDAGMGGFAPEWFKVQDMLSGIRNCSYDRHGYGHSSPVAGPRISSVLAEELYELLQQANQPGPYILVGHSFGGYNIRYFAGAWPGTVAGMVLVDSAHPEQFARMPSLPGNQGRKRRGSPLVANRTLRQVVVTKFQDDGVIGLYPAELRDMVRVLMHSGKSNYTERQEFLGFTHSASELDWVKFPQDIPLAVVHRGRRVWEKTPIGDALEQEWLAMQHDLATLSGDSLVMVARNSGHMVHLEQPEVVVNAVRWVLKRFCVKAGSDCDSSQLWQ